MKKITFLSLLFLSILLLQSSRSTSDWGFFGHRKINRMAVFTLPPDLIGFYKKNIEFVTDHAVDPDKRRYATKHEAVRHYIDLDIWGEYPFEDFPRTQFGALSKYTDVFLINEKNDTVQILGNELRADEDDIYLKFENRGFGEPLISKKEYRNFIFHNILTQYYEDEMVVEVDSLKKYFGKKLDLSNCKKVIGKDRYSEYGILPFHLQQMQKRLTNAFKGGDANTILRLSADFGHYIGDAHVPLHTTENYNGQLTNQTGIHGFWESRIPELFAEKEYDFFVGKAEYIENKTEYFWNIVLDSHVLVDSVLGIEKELVKQFPTDKQFCFDERGERTIRTQCREFAKAYSDRMKGMVEERMTSSVRSLGSVWYTAWVDAGQPDLSDLGKRELTEEEKKELEKLEEAVKSRDIKGRSHDN